MTDWGPKIAALYAMADKGCQVLGVNEPVQREYLALLLLHAYREGQHHERARAQVGAVSCEDVP